MAIADDPIVALDWPRPDFNLACHEFLIGLLATFCPPEEDETDEPGAWLDWWAHPPTPAKLAACFAPGAAAFILDGDGPRFMQDREELVGETNRVETLLIDAPGAQTLKKNTDHFIKRNTVATMGRAAAAMALFTLQDFAPSGGAGNRVGLRGGGPLVTLAIPPAWANGVLPLWHLLWANVPVGRPAKLAEFPRVFPWLAATRTSENNRTTAPPDVHDLQAFWGMPRRIRLEFEDNPASLACDLGGAVDSVIVRGWRQRPYGVNYAAWGHHLSPYYRQKPADTEWLPVHAQPGGVGYRHWVGLLVSDGAALRRPALAISQFRGRRLRQINGGVAELQWRMFAAGFDLDNMKARGFAESLMPIIEPGDRAEVQQFDDMVRLFIGGAAEVAGLLGRAVRRALFSDAAKIPLDAGLTATLREAFWDVTEAPFQRLVHLAATDAGAPDTLRLAWLAELAAAARRLFDRAAPIDAHGADHRPDRIAAAARGLDFALRGYGKDGEALFKQLRLAPPESTTKAKPRRARA